MFENIFKFFKKAQKEKVEPANSKSAAKERLHLVLMQDRANVSADFLDLMKQEIIEVIKKYIEVDESAIDVRLTNKENEDGTNGAPALYANIPILNIKNETRKVNNKSNENKINELETNKKEEEKLESKDEKNKSKNNNSLEEKEEVIINDAEAKTEADSKKEEKEVENTTENK